jgi:Rrf2 family protein
MRFSKTSVMALDSLVLMGRGGKDTPVPLRHIAESLNASPTYLSKVLQQLSSAGHVSTVMGPRGGYKLARRPAEISVLNVVELFEKPASVGGEPISGEAAGLRGKDARHVLGKALQAMRQNLSRLTLADLIE